ncbi:CHAT domain-containing protein [Streptomyces sp. NPDC057199]|uniref:CHAT domain-containing protein n=1 Tax=Streptomyces sp. NPDC057199 TaxID=3346047 RepID=UPI003629D8F8
MGRRDAIGVSRASKQLVDMALEAVMRGDRAAVDVCLAGLRQRLDRWLVPKGDRVALLLTLSWVLIRQADPEGSDEAEATARTALGLIRGSDRARGDALACLARALLLRDPFTPGDGTLDEVVDLLHEAVELTPRDHPEREVRCRELLGQLNERFTRRRDPADIGRAIQLCRSHPELRGELPGLLRRRHTLAGDSLSRDEAAEVEASLVRDPLGASAIQAQRTGTVRDLEAYAAALGRAAEAAPYQTRGTDRPRHDLYATHAQVLADLFARAPHRLELLDEAIASQHEAIASADRDHTVRVDPYDLAQSMRDLLPAVVSGTKEGGGVWRHPARAAHLSNLAIQLLERHNRTGDEASLVEAEEALTESLAALPADDAQRGKILLNLSTVLHTRHRHARDPDLLRSSVACTREAAHSEFDTPVQQLETYALWGQRAAEAGAWQDAAEGHREAVARLSQVVPRHLHPSDQEERLSPYFGLASDATACALQAGSPAAALRVLEQGRGILHAHALDARDDLSAVRAADPRLATRLETVRRDLDALREAPSGPAEEAAVDRRHRLGEEWREAVARARRLPGLEDFLTAPGERRLRAATSDGPVVVVNVSRHRCDALVITGGGPADVAVVRLPRLRVREAAEQADRFHQAVRTANSPAGSLVERLTAQAEIRAILVWLWETVCGPVVEHLEQSAGWSDGPRRVWWSPTGALTRLPLHAAGDHTVTDVDPRPAVLDRVVSSYAPSLRVLGAAATAPVMRPARRLLTVALADTPGYPDLPTADEEAAVPRRLFSEGKTLTGDAASRSRVLRELHTSSWAHFACHAVTEPHAPSTSHLVLHDGPLTITEISRLRLDDAAFAYLSACGTGLGGHRLPNEALHVGAVFHLAGFSDVVASLWPLADDFAIRAAKEFYRNAASPGHPGALALHTALHALRDPMNPSVWAGLLHIGRG